jgi:hypothetical protein
MPAHNNEPLVTRRTLALVAGVFIVYVLALHFMGRIVRGKHGFGLWTSQSQGPDTSQMFADPYSFTHLVHGILFFGVLWLFRKRVPLRWRFILALLIEVAWEIVENSPLVINRFRAATMSLDYTGDSILNSVGDVTFCLLGFYLASRLSWKWSVALVVLSEVALLLIIRDNLFLSALMLLYPIRAIKDWQMAG